jgi:hypothetical protein
VEKSNKKLMIKIIGILLGISIVTALGLAFIVGKDKTFIVRFSDNLFLAGTGSLIVGIFFGIREKVTVFANKELFKNKEKNEEIRKKIKSRENKGTESFEEKTILRKEIFNMLYKTLLVSGFVCFLLSAILSIIIMAFS